jgi:hypothetical protein
VTLYYGPLDDEQYEAMSDAEYDALADFEAEVGARLTLSAVNAGTGALARIIVKPYLLANQHARATWARVYDAGLLRRVWVESRLRREHLLALLTDSGTFKAQVAAQDEFGVWSERSEIKTVVFAAYSAGATHASIGSGSTSDVWVDEPGVHFPDLSMGSGTVKARRTLVGPGFLDEVRRGQQAAPRAAFAVSLRGLDQTQTQLMHRFFQALNGPHKAFWFEHEDNTTGVLRRYAVRFRDATVGDELFGVEYSDMDFNLIELVGPSAGGDV